jgi:hypothetical protein
MERPELSDFVQQVISRGRITYGDIKRLQRKVLPDGVMTREEAEALLILDRTVERMDPTWAAYLSDTIVDFVVWGSRPTGYVDQETAHWLETLLCVKPTKVTRRILREVLNEAEGVDQVARNSMLACSLTPIRSSDQPAA